MDKLSVHQKSPKQAKAKKKAPYKVVYIGNPVHFETSAEQFLPLVQKLTGQGSDIANSSMLEAANGPPAAAGLDSRAGRHTGAVDRADLHADSRVGAHHEPYKRTASPFEMFDDAFTPGMLENFQGFVPASMFYDPPHVGAIGSVDQVFGG